MTEDQLEAALRRLGTQIDVPEPPDVAAKVRARLARRQRQVLRPILAAALAILLAFAFAFAVSPEVRAAVADFLGIEFTSEQPPPIPATPALPGERVVSLEEARAQFTVIVPKELGEPKEVRIIDNRVVSLIYDTFRLDEFDGDFRPAMGKFARAQDIERVQVKGTEALWIPYPHEVVYVDRDGQWQHQSARLSGKTLIWQANGKTMRLEGDLTKDRAISIASS